LLLYVDDIVFTGSSQSFLDHIISIVNNELSMTELGLLHHFLGISDTRDSRGLFLSKRQYILDLLSWAGMLECQPCRKLVDTASKLSSEGESSSGDGLYRSLTGALQYLTLTPPKLSYVVQQACLTCMTLMFLIIITSNTFFVILREL
jgi:hypothetical protein